MSKTVDEKMMQSVSQARTKLNRIKRDFEQSAGETDLKTRRQFDISEIGQALSIAQKAAEDTRKITKEREVTVHTLDLTCRALLAENPSVDSIAQVYTVIKELNDFEIDFSISTTLNRSQVASGSTELDASLTAKMIEAFWESTYTNHPDYDDYQKRMKEKKDKEKKQKDDARAQAKKKTDEQKNFIAKANKRKDDFVQQGEKYKQDYVQALEKEMKGIREKMRAHIDRAIGELEKEAASQQSILSGLGLFAFGKKKECREKIESLQGKISQMKTDAYFDRQLAPYQKKRDEAESAFAKEVDAHVRNAFVDEMHIDHEHQEKVRNLQPINELYWRKQGDMLTAENIVYALSGKEEGMTEAQLRDEWCCYDYIGSLYSLLSNLSRNGYIKSIYVNGERRYFHYDTKAVSRVAVPVPNPRYANTPWPAPRDVKEVLKWHEK